MTDETWKEKALCKGTDPNLFVPETYHNVKRAQAVCRNCPVKKECLDFAIKEGMQAGVWGGKVINPKSRRRRGAQIA